MRVLGQPLAHVALEAGELVGDAPAAHTRRPLPSQVAPDRLPVTAEVTGDRRDRPAPPSKSCCVHELLLCEHRAGPPPGRCGGVTASVGGGPAGGLHGGPEAHELGNFDDRGRGISTISVTARRKRKSAGYRGRATRTTMLAVARTMERPTSKRSLSWPCRDRLVTGRHFVQDHPAPPSGGRVPHVRQGRSPS